jgi:hypothetical protein
MSTENDDMHPVTRKELREEMQASDTRLDAKLSTLLGAIFAAMRAMKDELKDELAASERRLMTELGAHTRASTEDLTTRVRVVDDKYKDLPARVARLEAIAPAPKRRARKS